GLRQPATLIPGELGRPRGTRPQLDPSEDPNVETLRASVPWSIGLLVVGAVIGKRSLCCPTVQRVVRLEAQPPARGRRPLAAHRRPGAHRRAPDTVSLPCGGPRCRPDPGRSRPK